MGARCSLLKKASLIEKVGTRKVRIKLLNSNGCTNINDLKDRFPDFKVRYSKNLKQIPCQFLSMQLKMFSYVCSFYF